MIYFLADSNHKTTVVLHFFYDPISFLFIALTDKIKRLHFLLFCRCEIKYSKLATLINLFAGQLINIVFAIWSCSSYVLRVLRIFHRFQRFDRLLIIPNLSRLKVSVKTRDINSDKTDQFQREKFTTANYGAYETLAIHSRNDLTKLIAIGSCKIGTRLLTFVANYPIWAYNDHVRFAIVKVKAEWREAKSQEHESPRYSEI